MNAWIQMKGIKISLVILPRADRSPKLNLYTTN